MSPGQFQLAMMDSVNAHSPRQETLLRIIKEKFSARVGLFFAP
jgi:hypothetical protein